MMCENVYLHDVSPCKVDGQINERSLRMDDGMSVGEGGRARCQCKDTSGKILFLLSFSVRHPPLVSHISWENMRAHHEPYKDSPLRPGYTKATLCVIITYVSSVLSFFARYRSSVFASFAFHAELTWSRFFIASGDMLVDWPSIWIVFSRKYRVDRRLSHLFYSHAVWSWIRRVKSSKM